MHAWITIAMLAKAGGRTRSRGLGGTKPATMSVRPSARALFVLVLAISKTHSFRFKHTRYPKHLWIVFANAVIQFVEIGDSGEISFHFSTLFGFVLHNHRCD